MELDLAPPSDTYDYYALDDEDDDDFWLTSDNGVRWRLLIQRAKGSAWEPTTIIHVTSSAVWERWAEINHLDRAYYALCAERFKVKLPIKDHHEQR